MRSQMDLIHRVTVAQVGRSGADAVSPEERAAIEQWALALSAGQLHRLWQLLLKGHDEVRAAPDPLASAQMALLRVMHAADLPDPGTLAKHLEEAVARGGVSATTTTSAAPGPPAAPAANTDWAGLCDKVEQSGQLRISQIMRDWVRIIAFAPLSLTYALAEGYPGDPTPELRDALLRATGERWEVTRGEGEAMPSMREIAEAVKEAEDAAMRASPLVEAAFQAFPAAEFGEDERPQDSRGATNRRGYA
jgi:DNA polymerase-3 subunit gamma/tau